MTITTEVYNVQDFTFWSGACDTLEELTYTQQCTMWQCLEDVFVDGATNTEINDFVWFERDIIAEWLGFEDFDALMKYNRDEEV